LEYYQFFAAILIKKTIVNAQRTQVGVYRQIIQEEFRHVAFIKLSFDQAQAGKKRGHIFIVANLPELPPQSI